MTTLGLERRKAPIVPLHEYVAQRYGARAENGTSGAATPPSNAPTSEAEP